MDIEADFDSLQKTVYLTEELYLIIHNRVIYFVK